MAAERVIDEIMHHDAVAAEYDGLYVTPRKYRFLGKELVNDLVNRYDIGEGARVLDIGAGTGSVTVPLATRFIAYAVEPSLNAVKRLYQKAMAHCVMALGSHLPYRDGVFDAVVISKTLHHMPISMIKKSLNEAHRVLKSGGIMYIIEDHVLPGPLGTFQIALAGRVMPQRYPSGLPTHTPTERPLPPALLETMIKGAGFRIDRRETSFFYPGPIIEHIREESLAFNVWSLPRCIPIIRRLGGVIKFMCTSLGRKENQ